MSKTVFQIPILFFLFTLKVHAASYVNVQIPRMTVPAFEETMQLAQSIVKSLPEAVQKKLNQRSILKSMQRGKAIACHAVLSLFSSEKRSDARHWKEEMRPINMRISRDA